MMKRLFVMVGVLLGVAGCGIKTVPPMAEYTLKPQQDFQKTRQSSCKEKTLKVLEPFGSLEFTSNDMYYVVLPYEKNRFSQSSWAQSVTSNIYAQLLEVLRQSGSFKGVANYASVAVSDLVLEVEINDFKQYFTGDLQHSYVVSDITVTLVDAKKHTQIAQKRIFEKIETKTLDAKGGITALNEAFGKTLKELTIWMAKECR